MDCGLRIVCAHRDSDVVYCGIAVDAGTRHETDEEGGVAHLVEHLTFKGTERRNARQIITHIEGVGADLNAFTGKEETIYHCTLALCHLNRAIDLLLDIALHSTFPQQEMEREVEVVAEEIESYNDQPAELIYDEFESLLFPEHPLGRNILGTPDGLRKLSPDHLRRFTNRLYTPSRMVLFVYGRADMDQILRLVNRSRAMENISRRDEGLALGETPPSAPAWTGKVVRHKGCHQSHVMIGCRAMAATDPRYLHLFLLNNFLGGPAMSSRLNMALRERAGLVYTVESNLTAYTDTGVWSIYFGCDHKDVGRCCSLVDRQLERLWMAPLTQKVFDDARRQLKGQLAIAHDSSEGVAIAMGKRFLHYRRTQTLEELFERLDAITREQVCQTFNEIFSYKNLLTLVYTE